ncbi:hypothetical protein Tco_0611884, partial [Tanacetum coccineum]
MLNQSVGVHASICDVGACWFVQESICLYKSRYGPGYRDPDYGVGVGGHHHVEE